MTDKRIAVGYIRVSTDEQAREGLSLDAQRARIEEYASQNNMTLLKFYADDGVSGKIPIKKRKALSELLTDITKREFDTILFIRLDRWFRNVGNYYEAQRILDQYNVKWATTNEDYSLLTANGQLMVNIRLAVAENESANTSERIKIVNQRKLQTGRPLTGSLPFGFTVWTSEDGKDKRVIKDPKTAPILKTFLEHFLKFGNVHQAMIHCNETHGTSVLYDTFARLLSNTLLYGTYHGVDGYLYGDPYIDKATFDKIQTMRKHNVRKSKQNTVFLFSGLVTCPACGHRMSGYHAAPHDTHYKHFYGYRCNFHHLQKQCGNNAYYGETAIEKELLETLADQVRTRIDVLSVDDNLDKGQDIEAQIEKLERKKKRLTDVYVDGRLDKEEYDLKYVEINNRIDRLREVPTQQRDLTRLKEFLKSDWKGLYDKLDRQHQQGFWKQLISNIQIDPETREIKRIIFV